MRTVPIEDLPTSVQEVVVLVHSGDEENVIKLARGLKGNGRGRGSPPPTVHCCVTCVVVA